jgi:hypothetical protein
VHERYDQAKANKIAADAALSALGRTR